jgi:F-type H+-transporting ATPase subunit delta
MATKGGALRYAQAIFLVARERNELDRWQADLTLLSVLSTSAELIGWLENPRVRFEVKRDTLARQFGGVNPLAMNLLYLLTSRGRVALLSEIRDSYQTLLNVHRGIQEAEVTTAVALDAADEQRLAERLGAIIGKKLVIKPRVDAAIIGGFVARIDDKLMDASAASRLLALKHVMER